MVTIMKTLSLTIDPVGDEITALYEPSNEDSRPSLENIHNLLVEAGFGEAELDQQAIIDFSIEIQTSNNVVNKVLGKIHDAQFALDVADDLMSAQLSLKPARGGKSITTEVNDELRALDIRFGIDHAALDAAIAVGICDKLTIARGDMPINGTMARFDILFHAKSRKDMDDNKAIIKLSDLGNILLVEAGEQLMRRTPSIKGRNGFNIKGEIIPPAPLPDMPYTPDLTGTKISEADPNLLVSICAGQPKQVKNGVIVNPIIEVEDVDLSTGNINFDGTINVTGDIKAGMRVNVTGDVFVNGVIEAAEIIAGHDVNVKHGIIGKSDNKSHSQQIVGNDSAHIRCGGSVRAQFIENAKIEADESIEVEQSILQSDLVAGNQVVVGKTSNDRSHIIGGRIQATQLVKTGSLGSSTGVKTIVQVGIDPYLNQEIIDKEKVYQKKMAELDSIIKLLNLCKANDTKKFPPEVIQKAESTHQQLVDEIGILHLELMELSEKLELVEHAKIVVGTVIFGGAHLFIGKQSWSILEEQRACTVLLDQGKIAITN